MNLKQVTLSKQYKIGLPQFSNITVGLNLTWELAEGEDFDYRQGWDLINQQLDMQAQNGNDPSWMSKREEYKDHYSTVIKTPKGGTSGNNNR